MQQMTDKKNLLMALTVGCASGSVSCAWNYQQIEIFVGFNQSVNYLHGARWIHISAQFARNQK